MSITLTATKRVVSNLEASERFYRAIGLRFISRNVGGEDEVRQEQSWLSASGDMNTHVLILTRFLELPPPHRPAYPGEAWLAFTVTNVDETLSTVEASGGAVVRPAQDRPEHNVRAAVVSDPEGHFIEIVGPMSTAERE
jgi:catechol 2,3-dioxygenase-like lactoylglutathione lyase family enzyme